jgi:hypothetical protein
VNKKLRIMIFEDNLSLKLSNFAKVELEGDSGTKEHLFRT